MYHFSTVPVNRSHIKMVRKAIMVQHPVDAGDEDAE